MQSSSSGMLSVLGLLACAAAAGVFAARKWPQGPPPDLRRTWDWLAREVLQPSPAAQTHARDYGPAPRYDGTASAGLYAPPNCPAPPVVVFDEPPPMPEESSPGQPTPGAFSAAATTEPAPPVVRPASVPRAPRYEPAKTSAFWPDDLASLMPGSAAPSPASRSQGFPGTAPSIEERMRRLEQMGAVVLRLERQRGTRDSAHGGYLFRCELPLPQTPRYHRFFQAADADPARAIERVTRDVEAWKATQRR